VDGQRLNLREKRTKLGVKRDGIGKKGGRQGQDQIEQKGGGAGGYLFPESRERKSPNGVLCNSPLKTEKPWAVTRKRRIHKTSY